CGLELEEMAPCGVHVTLGQCPLHPLGRADELWGLGERRPEVHVHVGRRGPVHPGDLHVAPERDRADPVFDPLALDLDERRREADVEAARAHADGSGGEEVAGLVDEHEQPEAEDGDEEAHVTTAPAACSASRRASASASTSPSRSLAAAPSAAAIVSSTTSAIRRNGSRPARKACTATSFAALYAQG